MSETSADPQSDPAYVPDTSRGLPVEIANSMGDWARHQQPCHDGDHYGQCGDVTIPHL